MKSADVTADILNYLSDGKVHTLDEIACEIECSKSTVQRHISSLSYRYPIISIRGGAHENQGIKLETCGVINNRILTRLEQQTLRSILEKSLETCNLSPMEQSLVKRLLSK